ncbi:hypothetical protein [Bradyrhizobium algeriense]|uniref:hypothetical protein n=1 Tax=Bradyrhizobium algeriense TaxID=634784 RepID=UPI00167D663E|nr:hypothetical protein [Bradyrhizobium algeriense]
MVPVFSAGPGNYEIKFAEVSCSKGSPVKITAVKLLPVRHHTEKCPEAASLGGSSHWNAFRIGGMSAMNKLPLQTRVQILTMLCEGNSSAGLPGL